MNTEIELIDEIVRVENEISDLIAEARMLGLYDKYMPAAR